VTDEKPELSAGLRAAADAIALVRATLAGNTDEASRILAEPRDPSALPTCLAYMVTYALQQLPDALMEDYLAEMLHRMQDRALDAELET
jgi:hypothetical protein